MVMTLELLFFNRRTDIGEGRCRAAIEAAGMGDNRWTAMREFFYRCLHVPVHERDKPPGMIDVPVRECKVIEVKQVNSHLICIAEKQIRVPDVKKALLFALFNVKRQSMFSGVVMTNERVVVYEHGDREIRHT
jgi:hypothetical protein